MWPRLALGHGLFLDWVAREIGVVDSLDKMTQADSSNDKMDDSDSAELRLSKDHVLILALSLLVFLYSTHSDAAMALDWTFFR